MWFSLLASQQARMVVYEVQDTQTTTAAERSAGHVPFWVNFEHSAEFVGFCFCANVKMTWQDRCGPYCCETNFCGPLFYRRSLWSFGSELRSILWEATWLWHTSWKCLLSTGSTFESTSACVPACFLPRRGPHGIIPNSVTRLHNGCATWPSIRIVFELPELRGKKQVLLCSIWFLPFLASTWRIRIYFG